MTAVAEKGPLDDAGCVSRLLLFWVGDLLRTGYKRPLQLEDIWPLGQADEATVQLARLRTEWDREVALRSVAPGKRRPPSLARVLWRLYKAECVAAGLLYCIFCVASFCNPVLLARFVRLLEREQASDQEALLEGLLYVLGFFLLNVSMAATSSLSDFFSTRIGLQGRAALCALIFEHGLELRTLDRPPQGKLVNLMAADTEKFVEFMKMAQRIWTAPLIIVCGLIYMYSVMGPSVLAGFGLMCLFAPVTAKIGLKQKKLFAEKMGFADRRVQLSNEMVQGAKLVKLYAWERPLLNRVLDQRTQEMKKLSLFTYFRALTMPVTIIVPTVASVVAFLTYAATSSDASMLGPADAFTMVSMFTLIRAPFSTGTQSINSLVQLLTALDRIGKFFGVEPVRSEHYVRRPEEPPQVRLRGSFAWPPGAEQKEPVRCLDGVDIEVRAGQLVALVGRVGSGKSAVLAALLGELDAAAGAEGSEIDLHGRCAVCTQEPFIQNKTVRDNILFGQKFDAERYQAVLQGCALSQDMAILPAGDQTEIGEKGINLSGGQRARISLARAAYSSAEVVLLDDPLSAVDAHVGKQLFEECINGPLMQGRTRLVITNQLQILPSADSIVALGPGGTIEASGTYKELMESSPSFQRLLESAGTEEAEAAEEQIAAVQFAPPEPAKPKEPEANQLAQGGAVGDAAKDARQAQGKSTTVEHRVEGKSNFVTYKDYFVAGAGGYVGIALLLLICVLAESGFILVDTWLGAWASDVYDQDMYWYMAIYGGITGGYITVQISRSTAMAAFGLRASRRLHQRMVERIFRSPLVFFESTPSGRIMNRLSRDVADIDTMIGMHWELFFMCTLRVLSILTMLSVLSPTFMVTLIPLGFAYFHFREVYRRTGRELKRLESISRSPMLAQFGEVLSGTGTIKCYGLLRAACEEQAELLRRNTRVLFAVKACETWLGYRLMLLGALVVSLTALSLNFFPMPGFAGLALAYAINITVNLQGAVRTSAEVEAKMVAVERLLEYANLEPEAPPEAPGDAAVPADWPQQGGVAFTDVELRYRPDLPTVLKKLTLDIKPGERVGVVGRTGAGKSSLFVALFRVRELCGGHIKIDGVDVSALGMRMLRSRLTIIPQEPVLFMGSLRYNLDILGEFTDNELWAALEKASLVDFVQGSKSADEASGLDLKISDRGESLSAGQRQLVCLARALLRQPRLLMLDEATASVDVQSDAMIQNAIRAGFGGATVITIAHRLLTIADSDRILVMDQGAAKEFAAPSALLADPQSDFVSLVNETGPQADLIYQIARGDLTLNQLYSGLAANSDVKALTSI